MTPQWREGPVLVLAGVLLALVVLEATVAPHYAPKFSWHRLPGYATLIGGVAAALLVWVVPALGRAGLQRPERNDD